MSLATTPRTRYITIGDAAEYLSVTERTVRNYIARGELTGYRIGTRAIRIDQRELENLLTPIPTVAGGGR
ncbi:helix-turn-helix domain-containing protein [Brachybacterium sp. p3-SID957]|uniref:helix-turn-helix domain-containing protein n=1 Tax=Brachybacterium sp. p3-SID957 TaxID=2916049 RepID=UPI00223C4326|nr:helix-turn-helix domain-containing protein [Brachybacterium sp. p3-SID957]MCT1776761.1 helix-turn-helix domain-containing protein [Brachybacterium sp. p3-SID957]